MATDKAFYIGSTQVGPDTLSSAVLTDGVYRTLIDPIDWGAAPAAIFEQARPLMDGNLRRGKVFSARDFVWTLASRVNLTAGGVTAANVERIRDSEQDALLSLLSPYGGLLTVRQDRMAYSATAVSRVLYAEPTALPAWKWNPKGMDGGYAGLHDNPHLVVPINWRAPFPWFMDRLATATTNYTLDGSLRNSSSDISNTGHVPCGVRAILAGTFTNATVLVRHTTASGPSPIDGGGFTLTGLNGSSKTYTVDFYVDDPLVFTAYDELDATLFALLDTGAYLALDTGAATLEWQVTSGSVSGGTIRFEWRNCWGAP